MPIISYYKKINENFYLFRNKNYYAVYEIRTKSHYLMVQKLQCCYELAPVHHCRNRTTFLSRALFPFVVIIYLVIVSLKILNLHQNHHLNQIHLLNIVLDMHFSVSVLLPLHWSYRMIFVCVWLKVKELN